MFPQSPHALAPVVLAPSRMRLFSTIHVPGTRLCRWRIPCSLWQIRLLRSLLSHCRARPTKRDQIHPWPATMSRKICSGVGMRQGKKLQRGRKHRKKMVRGGREGVNLGLRQWFCFDKCNLCVQLFNLPWEKHAHRSCKPECYWLLQKNKSNKMSNTWPHHDENKIVV